MEMIRAQKRVEEGLRITVQVRYGAMERTTTTTTSTLGLRGTSVWHTELSQRRGEARRGEARRGGETTGMTDALQSAKSTIGTQGTTPLGITEIIP